VQDWGFYNERVVALQLCRQAIRVDSVRQQKLVALFVVMSSVCLSVEDDTSASTSAIGLHHEAVGVEVVDVLETAR